MPMHAAVILECDTCGTRFAWPAFTSQVDAVHQAHLAAQLSGLVICPICTPGGMDRVGAAPFAMRDFGQQIERGSGKRFLDGRQRAQS